MARLEGLEPSGASGRHLTISDGQYGRKPLLRIATVTALAGQRLRIGLTDGTIIEREVGPLVNGSVFQRYSGEARAICAGAAERGTVVWSRCRRTG